MAANTTDLELPPPAYSEEEEYDRKTATAIELSLSPSNQQESEQEEWEEWNEVKFEEAARQRQTSSSRPATNAGPSSIRALPSLPQKPTISAETRPVEEKKSSAFTQSVKPRPSWFEEAGLSESSAGSSSGSSCTSSSASSNGTPTHRLMVHNLTLQDEESFPPPFTPIAPLLTGQSFGGIPVGEVVTLSYSGRSNPNHITRLGPPPGTPPPSSHHVPTIHHVPTPPPSNPNPSFNRQPFQVEPLVRPQSASTVRTTSSGYSGPAVRMCFDPSIAYAKAKALPIVERQSSQAEAVNPLELYNSSVSSVLAPPSQPFNRPHMANQAQNSHFPNYLPPPVSPRPIYVGTPPPNINATQFPLQPTLSPPALDTNSYQYQGRWASSEQQFAQFG